MSVTILGMSIPDLAGVTPGDLSGHPAKVSAESANNDAGYWPEGLESAIIASNQRLPPKLSWRSSILETASQRFVSVRWLYWWPASVLLSPARADFAS